MFGSNIGGGILEGMGLREAKSIAKDFEGDNINGLTVGNKLKVDTAGKGFEIASQTLISFGMGANSAISGACSMAAAGDQVETTQARTDQALAEKAMQLWEKSGEKR